MTESTRQDGPRLATTRDPPGRRRLGPRPPLSWLIRSAQPRHERQCLLSTRRYRVGGGGGIATRTQLDFKDKGKRVKDPTIPSLDSPPSSMCSGVKQR